MHSTLVSVLLLSTLALITLITARESVSFCPNDGKPKLDNDGQTMQCLPGHDKMCGKGFSCYFSGLNYQCCPAEEDERVEQCPEGAFTVVDSEGAVLSCDLHQPCPQETMACTSVGEKMICCEGADRWESSLEDSTSPIIECPKGSSALVDESGDVVQCEDSICNQHDTFCHEESGSSMCCQTAPSKSSHEGDALKPSLFNPLKFEPNPLKRSKLDKINKRAFLVTHKKGRRLGISMAKNVGLVRESESTSTEHMHKDSHTAAPDISTTETDLDGEIDNSKQTASTPEPEREQESELKQEVEQEPEPEQEPESERVSAPKSSSEKVASSTVKRTGNKKEDYARTPTRYYSTSRSSEHAKAHGNRLATMSLIPTETIQYARDNAGGYAVSRAFSVKTARQQENNRETARKYLMDKIRQGWPYEERYFRPASRTGGMPLAQNAQIVFNSQ